MGSSNGITRGQLRPHFSGRSPPFVLAALCVGLGILGISYWSLSQQYNELEEQLKKTLIRKDSIENDLTFIQNQLNLREEEFSRVKKSVQKNELDLNSANADIKTKADQINSFNTKVRTLNDDISKCNEELNKKTNELGDAFTKLKDIDQQKDDLTRLRDQNQELDHLKDEKKRLETQLEELRKQMTNNICIKNISKSDANSVFTPSSAANVGQIQPNVDPSDSLFNSDKWNSSLTKPQVEANNGAVDSAVAPNRVEDLNDKQPVIAEPVKQSQLVPTNVLAEEDRKEEALVEANETNNNEIADEMKAEINKDEEFKDKQQI